MSITPNTTIPDLSLPVGAVSTEEWQPNFVVRGYYRSFEGETREIVADTRYGAHTVAAYARGVQHNDGRIDDGATDDPVFAAPTIDLSTIDEQGRRADTDISLTSDAARRLADVLIAAADEIDAWTNI
jgi:hypothetical protein